MGEIFAKSYVLKTLELLKTADPQFRVFGANVHKYRLNPPIEDDTLAIFERARSISLPEDYRLFLTELGNGGAGPFYGVYMFGEQDDQHDHCKWEDGFVIGDVSKPFVHTEAWNLPQEFWDSEPDLSDVSEDEEERLIAEWDAKLEEHYWARSVMNGAIPIGHQGCALRIWLVVHGPQRGNVWSDERADNRGLLPILKSDGSPMSFSDWYLHWLRNPSDTRALSGRKGR